MVLEGGTPGPEGTDHATREERGRFSSSEGIHDVDRTNPSGHPSTEAALSKRNRLRFSTTTHNIGTWNVRGMNTGKLEIVKQEMQRLSIDLLGISELHWTGNGYFKSDDYTIFYSGNDVIRRNGVAIIATKSVAKAVHSFNAISDRLMSIRINGSPRSITVLQAYAPTTDATEEDIEDFYAKLQTAIDQTPTRDIIFVMGDLNAKVGSGEDLPVVGKWGLGERNDAGDRLIQCCVENRLSIMNTWFEQPKRRLYTWTAPNAMHRNQIDYILCQRRWKSSILSAKTYPGADCGSDHQLLVTKIKVRFSTIKRPPALRRFDMDNIPAQYAVEVKNRFEALSNIDEEPEGLWEEIKSIVRETAEENIPFKKLAKRAKWLTDEAIEIAEHRRTAKATGNIAEFRMLNAAFQRRARQDKEAYWNTQCAELEKAIRHGHTRALFTHVKQARAPFAARKASAIKDSDGTILQEEEQIKRRWRDYTEELYAGNPSIQLTDQSSQTDQEPGVLEEEVKWALKQLPNRKAPGTDNLPAELLKPVPVKILTKLCQKIWTTKSWPKDWTRSVFVTLPKKGDLQECSNYRTIALISHASKILLKIIQNRIAAIVERELPDVQAGFRKGRGTRDQIANLRWIMEKTREYQKDIYLCFIDYTKAFDCVDHDKLWACLKQMGVPEHIEQLIRALYSIQEATVRTPCGNTDWFRIGKGVRQGCILSPALFNLYAETIMRRCNLDESEIGVNIGGRTINNLRYADDTTMLAESERDLEYLIRRVQEESERMGLYLNIKKTKVMTTAGNGAVNIQVHNEKIESVQDFVFLGAKIDQNGESGPDIKRRIALGRVAMQGMDKIWKSKDVSIATKTRLVNAIVFPIATYGCESWTIRKAERRKIDAFELWCWRRLLRIPWTAGTTNKTVLDRTQPKMSLEGKIVKQQLSFFGHVMRAKSLETSMMLGKVSGTRRRGRQRIRWLDTITKATSRTIAELKEAVEDRNTWRGLIHKVAESRLRLNG